MTAPDLDALISRLKGMAADWPFDDYTNAADLADAAWAALVRLREENARLTKEYEAVCNEVFGSQCATIPDAFLEIGKLKLAHNKQYQRAERAEVEVARIKSEVEFLHKRRGEIVIDRDRYRAALGKYPEGRDVMLGGALAEVERSRKRIAALEAERDALREPTETMIVAGVKTLLTGHDSQRHYVAALWRRMFDAAKEKP